MIVINNLYFSDFYSTVLVCFKNFENLWQKFCGILCDILNPETFKQGVWISLVLLLLKITVFECVQASFVNDKGI